jgi:predicted solute-binding protein
MRIVVHDTLVTAPFILPRILGWIESELAVEPRTELRGGDVGPEMAALIPSAEVALLQETHQIVPDVAVVANGEGAIAMRVPVRPDEIEATAVRLYDVSGTAEILARATLEPFYGIDPTAWTRDDAPRAQVVVVEGAEALREPEAGHAEDLCRAWFILTGQPVVTHVLVAPKTCDRAAIEPATETLHQLRTLAAARRRDLRRELAARDDLDRDRLTRLFAAQRLHLAADDRRALLMLLQRGNRGSAYPYVWELAYLEPESMGGEEPPSDAAEPPTITNS